MGPQRFLILSLLFGVAESALHASLADLSLAAYDPHTPQKVGTAEASVSKLQAVKEQGVGAKISTIFPVICIMYGSLAICWFIFSKLPKDANGESNQTAKVLLLCFSWISMSVGMHMLNKTLSVTLGTPCLLALAQMAVAVIIFGATSWKHVVDSDKKQLLMWMIVPMFFASMLISSFYTYEYISLSLFTIFRNLTPLVVLPIETALMPDDKKPHVNLSIIGSILVMFLGAVVYGGSLQGISLVGILFAVLNMVLACSDRLIQRRLLTDQCNGLSSSTCSILNNGMAMLPTVALAMMTQEVTKVTSLEGTANWTDPQTMVLLAMSGFVGMGICYLGFECQRVLSATSFFVMQNLSKVAVVAVGVLVFGDPLSSPFAVLGLVLSLGGSALYGHAQMEVGKTKATETEKLVKGKV